MMTKPVYDGAGNIIEFSPDNIFAESPICKIFTLNDSRLLKIFSNDAIPRNIKQNIDFVLLQNFSIERIHFPQSLIFAELGNPVGYTMLKPQGENMLRSIFIKSQFRKLFPSWSRFNLATLCISLLKLIRQLHHKSVLIGNLNPKSIYIKSDTEISFINADEFVYLKNDENKSELDYQHDDFITAVFIYMILIPGKPPFQVKLGTNALDNLMKMFQSISMRNDATWEPPDDEDKYLWDNLPEELRTSFHQIFNKKKRFTEDMWVQQLENFRNELLENKHKVMIFKKNRERKSFKYTTSMNLHDGGIGDDRTVLCQGTDKHCKIAVIELSTKAVKLLIGEKDCVKERFEFDAFSRTADLTNTGKGLDDNNRMSLAFFENSVAPSIERFIKIAQDSDVTEVFSVATAAYRAAHNNDEILQYIKDKFNLNVRILSKEEEAQASFNAFVFSGRKFIKNLNDFVILVDQGGGSTEISFFQNLKLQKSISLNLGTTVLQNILRNKSSMNLALSEALHETDDVLFSRLEQYFEDIEEFRGSKEFNCIALGSAITAATNVRGNKQQHGTRLTSRDIYLCIEETEKKLIRNFPSINALMNQINKENTFKRSALENLLVMRLGLPMYLKIFEFFNINELVVSGTGLWYGIFWQKCLQP